VVRHIRWQVALILVGVLLLGGLMAYLATSFTTQREPAPGGTYVEGLIGSPQFINPLLCQYNDADRDLCALIFSGLIRYDEHGLPQPDLAERWDISADGLVYTIYLRPNARWHDDQPVTAADVAFTLQLLQDPGYPGSPDVAALWRTVQITEVNSLAVQMTLQEPLIPFLQYLTIGILPKHLLGGVTAVQLPELPFNRKPIGSGPFKVEAFGSGEAGQPQHILLDAYPGYYGRQPYISKIDFKFYPDFPSMLAAYRAGEIQGLNHIPAGNLSMVSGEPTLKLYTGPVAGYSMIFLNQGDDALPFFQNQQVRQALWLSLDRQKLLEEVLHNQGTIANSPIIPGTWASATDLPPLLPDINRAQQLLAQAGWLFPGALQPAGQPEPGNFGGDVVIPSTPTPQAAVREAPLRVKDGLPISFTLYTNSDSQHVALANAIAKQWLNIGVKAAVVPVQAGLVSNYLAPRAYQAALVDVQLPNDPDPYPFWHETQANAPGQNYSQYKDRDMSEVLEQARRAADLNTRIDLYHKFQQMFVERVPGILLFYPVYTYGVSEKVADVQIGPIAYPSDRFRTLPDWYVLTRRVIVGNAPLIK
jgi:peptide/nickel transport system substrate-binding protein